MKAEVELTIDSDWYKGARVVAHVRNEVLVSDKRTVQAALENISEQIVDVLSH